MLRPKEIWATFMSLKNSIVLLVILFGVVIVFIGAAKNLFGFQLTPHFAMLVDKPIEVFKLLADIFIFSWMMLIVELIGNLLVYCYLKIIGVEFFWWNVSIPDGLKDWSLLSIALSRVFLATDVLYPRAERDLFSSKTTSLEEQIVKTSGPWLSRQIHDLIAGIHIDFFYPIIIDKFEILPLKFVTLVHKNRSLKIAIDRAWKIKLTAQTKRLKPAKVGRQIGYVVAGALFWGFIRPLGYIFNLLNTRGLGHVPIIAMRRKVAVIFVQVFIIAIIATGLYFFSDDIYEWASRA